MNCSKFSITSCVAWSSWFDDKRGSRSFTAKLASFSDFKEFIASFSKVVDFWFNNQENDNKLLEHADDLGENLGTLN